MDSPSSLSFNYKRDIIKIHKKIKNKQSINNICKKFKWNDANIKKNNKIYIQNGGELLFNGWYKYNIFDFFKINFEYLGKSQNTNVKKMNYNPNNVDGTRSLMEVKDFIWIKMINTFNFYVLIDIITLFDYYRYIPFEGVKGMYRKNWKINNMKVHTYDMYKYILLF